MGKKPRKKTAKARSSPRTTGNARVASSRVDWQKISSGLPAASPEVVTTAPAAPARRPGRVAPAPGERAAESATSGPPAPPAASESRPASTAAHVTGGCSAILDEAGPPGLAATYWFDAPASGGPSSVTVRFTGVRTEVDGAAEPRDRFERVERVDGIPAGSGRVAVTTRMQGVNRGTWRVTATPGHDGAGQGAASRLARSVEAVRTRVAPLAQGPGVRIAAWPALVGLGAVVAIVLQAVLVGRAGIDVPTTVLISLAACVVGFAGAKVWYLVVNRRRRPAVLAPGACIQGFLLACFATVALAGTAFGLPVGAVLDATAPGLFLGMAVGRPGCFLTGCCSGRPTNSRWGLWSSDRRVVIRRFPVQLVEAAMALVIGGAALAAVLTTRPPVSGVIFVGALAAYTLGRQLLFPLRGNPHTPVGRAITVGACGAVLLGVLAISVYA